MAVGQAFDSTATQSVLNVSNFGGVGEMQSNLFFLCKNA